MGFVNYFGQEYSDTWHAQLKVNKVKARCLISNKLRKTLKIPEPLNYRYLPSKFIFPSTTVVYEDKVLIIMWSSDPIAILIRGKEISDSYKEYFNLLWKIAKK